MKRNLGVKAAGWVAAVVMASVTVAAARAGVTPAEQSLEQTQTLSATQSTFYREIDSFTTFMPVMEIAARVMKKVAEEPTRLTIALNWAKDKSETRDAAKANALYSMIYSDLALRTAATMPKKSDYFAANSKAAYQALLTFEVMLLTDAARCVNPDAKSVIPALLAPRYAGLKYVSDAASPDEMSNYWRTALAQEAAAANRAGNGELCSNGVAAALAEGAGKAPPERLDASFIDDAKWKPLRERIRASIAQEWKGDYARAGKAWMAAKAQSDAQQAKDEAAKLQRAKDDAARKAQQQAAEAEKRRAEDEKIAREKQERVDAQKREQQKYHDTYAPTHSAPAPDDYTPYDSAN